MAQGIELKGFKYSRVVSAGSCPGKDFPNV